MDTQYAAAIALDILRNGMHLPIVNGKVNRDNIEEELVMGILSKELGPMDQEFVNLIIESLEDLVRMNIKGSNNV